MTFIVSNLHAQVVDTVCVGYTDVRYTVDQQDGSTYEWNVDGGTITSGNGTNSITVNWAEQPGTFRMSVVEQNERLCWGDTVFAYVVVRGSEFKTHYPLEACRHDSITIRASGGIWYQWSMGETDSLVRIRLDHDTTLSVLISDTACGLRTDTFTMNIKAIEKPNVAYRSETEDFYKDQTVFFSYSGDPKDKVYWEIDKTMLRHFRGRNVNVRFADTGDAVIKLVSMNSLGCSDSLVRTINIKGEQLYFPSAFTPNNDGLNDIFKPGGSGIVDYHMAVYNRWGQKIFETSDMHHGWDGTASNGEQVATDTYMYQCDARGYSGKLYTYNGNITILK